MQQVAQLEKPHLFTASEYMNLQIEARTELLAGVIYDVSPKNEPHSFAVSRLTAALNRALSNAYEVRIRDPIIVSGWEGRDAPEIDIAVIAAKTYAKTPTAKDASAFVEVSDSTYGGQRGDRLYKIPLYVRAGVQAWIVNITLQQVECYDSLEDLDREHGRVFKKGESFDILGVATPVDTLFRDY
jgi:Uma2 family endonuclease